MVDKTAEISNPKEESNSKPTSEGVLYLWPLSDEILDYNFKSHYMLLHVHSTPKESIQF